MFLQEKALLNLSVGSEEWFSTQRKLILDKALLKYCYDDWYKRMIQDAKSVANAPGILLEIGSGGSHLKSLQNDVVTSDIVPGVADLVIDAQRLPFENSSVKAIFLTHSFHHIPNVELFLEEANRVLVPGGVISMIEVAHTPFAKFFFSHFHPEPFDDQAKSWIFKQEDPMNDSNQALSWAVFFRDRARFQGLFPKLRLEKWSYLPWFSYLASGGVTRKPVIPSILNPFAIGIDWLTKPARGLFSLHWHLTVRKSPR